MLPNQLFCGELILLPSMNSWHMIISHLRKKEHAVSNAGFLMPLCFETDRKYYTMEDTPGQRRK